MDTPDQERAPRYLQLGRAIAEQIRTGTLRLGEKLPSVRSLSSDRGVSISTVLQAYQWLENQGLIRAASALGILCPHSAQSTRTRTELPELRATADQNRRDADAGRDPARRMNPANVSLEASAPSPQLFPTAKLNKIIRRVIQEHPDHSSRYIFPPGLEALRREIARRLIEFGCSFTPDDVVITSGGIEAIVLSLRAIAKAGDVVAIESPTTSASCGRWSHWGCGCSRCRLIREPEWTGAFERAIKRHKIKACVLCRTATPRSDTCCRTK